MLCALGVPAFLSVIGIFWLMVFKPVRTIRLAMPGAACANAGLGMR